jgi:FKBP-type peptidyl-prolyl cis-trans isomerase
MTRRNVVHGLLIAALLAALPALGCRKTAVETAPPPPAAPPQAAKAPAAEAPKETQMKPTESEAVQAARKLGTPTSNPVVTTASGLQYIDVKVGEGAEAKAGGTVTVHYTGWLVNGTKFDSSRDRGQPFSFPLGAGRVIKGWDEGVAGMKPGGVRKLIIPAALGYGARGIGPIPPNSILIFEVELLKAQ